nr:hypothetical protein Itr_chr12CG25700 [Ipomoea trifida]
MAATEVRFTMPQTSRISSWTPADGLRLPILTIAAAKSERKAPVRFTMLLADFDLDAGRWSQVAYLDHCGGEVGE